jgi:hypothetical protein
VRECENKRREKELALGCPCGCVTRLWMLAGVGERERDTERERERERGFRDCVVRVGGSFGRVRVREDCCWGGAFGEECRVLWVEIFLVLVFVVGYC